MLVIIAFYIRTPLPDIVLESGIGEESADLTPTLFLLVNVIAFILAVLLIYQDIRKLIQTRHNETLSQKQTTIDELLASMRDFRHNIANLIYGMEGAMINNDAVETREYYRQMVEKCTLINSENIIAVQNLTIAPLSALLLRKPDIANQQKIPIYLYIEPRVSIRRLPKSDLCEIAGVLLDNASEAANESPAPYVSLELRALTHEVELIVRNTYADCPELNAPAPKSTKAGHEGVGIASVRKLIQRHPRNIPQLPYCGALC